MRLGETRSGAAARAEKKGTDYCTKHSVLYSTKYSVLDVTCIPRLRLHLPASAGANAPTEKLKLGCEILCDEWVDEGYPYASQDINAGGSPLHGAHYTVTIGILRIHRNYVHM